MLPAALWKKEQAYIIHEANSSTPSGRGIRASVALVFLVEEGWCKVEPEMESCVLSGSKNQMQKTGASINKWESELDTWRVVAEQA